MYFDPEPLVPLSKPPGLNPMTVTSLIMELIFQCKPLMATVRFDPFIIIDANGNTLIDTCRLVVRFTFIHAHADIVIPQINVIIAIVQHFLFNIYHLIDRTFELQKPLCQEKIHKEQIGRHEYGHTKACFCLQADLIAYVEVKHKAADVNKMYVNELSKSNAVVRAVHALDVHTE